MSTVFQVVFSVLIIAALIYYLKRNSRSKTGATLGQLILAGWQIILCGWFFSLCLSDGLDFNVNFSYLRFSVNLFYSIAFLSIGIYVLFTKHRKKDNDLRGVVIAFIALIAVQCFVFPYETELEFWRVFEALEGAVVFALLILVLLKIYDESFCKMSLLAATILEFIVAIENVIMPFKSITEEIQPVDIPLNYASLFMRPALMASLTLVYRVWLDERAKES